MNHQFTDNYELSFHTIGRSPQPIIMVAKQLKAKEIHLLHTVDTISTCQEVEKELPNKTIMRHEIDRIKPAKMYKAVNTVLQTLPTGSIVAFDATSGTNKMVAAVSMLVFQINSKGKHKADLFFMDFKEYDPKLRRPVAGSEYLWQFELPS